MNMSGNVILITGGGSGIGRALAEAFYALGNEVIIGGRRGHLLEHVCALHPGMRHVVFDGDNADDILRMGHHLAHEAPGLNILINNAGIQRPENLLENNQSDWEDAEATITTNLLGPIRLGAALLPQLARQKDAAIINVTSGLAFVPMKNVPTYCATKAGMHAYTMALREQLKALAVQVIEVIPPYVQTDLGPGHGTDPMAMPLDAFIKEVIQLLRDFPDAPEVVVERCKPLRYAAENGHFGEIFSRLNAIGPVAGLPPI